MSTVDREALAAIREGSQQAMSGELTGELEYQVEFWKSRARGVDKAATEYRARAERAEGQLAQMTRARDAAIRDGQNMMLDQREMRERAEGLLDTAVARLRRYVRHPEGCACDDCAFLAALDGTKPKEEQ